MVDGIVEICELVPVRELHLLVNNVEAVDDDGGGEDCGGNEGPHQTGEGSQGLPEGAGWQWLP